MAYRFSGHETFPCRYAWLPKAFKEISNDPTSFADEEQAMIRLGVGKNMVRAIRFWMLETSIVSKTAAHAYEPTPFAKAILGQHGFDPFLEDIRTLWLIHWNLSTYKKDEPLFAWDFLLNHWQAPEISRSEVLQAFRKAANAEARPPSDVTLEQHFDTFLHTYVPTRSRKGDIQEDNLDCPLVELEFLQVIGERRLDGSGKREPIYAFRREEKQEITPELFAYCLGDFWQKRWSAEKTLSFKEVAFGQGSPGQILKLPEWNIRQRLEAISSDTNGFFRYTESAAQQQVSRNGEYDKNLLKAIYRERTPC